MIINNIEIENFTCYCGKVIFEFTEGLNIIIGDNTIPIPGINHQTAKIITVGPKTVWPIYIRIINDR